MTSKAEVFGKRRRKVISAAISKHNVDTLIITNKPDILYLTGCHEGAAALLFDRRNATLFAGKMFEHAIPKEAPGSEVKIVTKPVFIETANIVNKMHRRAIGFQGIIPSNAYNSLRKAMGRRKLVDIADLVTVIRGIKDDGEISKIKKCVNIAEAAFADIRNRGAKYLIGRTEKQIAAELEYRMRQLGADRQGFQENNIIVGSGPNSASCHHVPTTRKVRAHEPLLFDWGAELDNYRSDITRTFFIKTAPDHLAEIYEVVRKANKAGIEAVKSGVETYTVACKAWNVVREAGYGDLIRHGLGHGVGLDIHEFPSMGSGKEQEKKTSSKLKSGQVITIEPGIYIEGKGGVRLEDDVVVKNKGNRCLTTIPKDLQHAIIK